MSILRRAIGVTGWSALGGAVAFTVWTRNSTIHPLPPNDYLFNHTLFARYNPNDNPVMHDICVRKVSIDRIRPELLQKDGALVEAFCGGVYGGAGYAIQRRFLERKYRSPEMESDLWDPKRLEESSYEVGTRITNHFEVQAKNSDSIILRAGDSPSVLDPRESDGLFEVTAEVKKDAKVVEFGLKSVFFNGVALPDQKTGKVPDPIPGFARWLHEQYDKVLMETAIKRCMI